MHPIDDATAEELLSGRPVSADLEPLTTVVRTLREVSSRPVRPSAELAARMAAGVFAGEHDTPVGDTADRAGLGAAAGAARGGATVSRVPAAAPGKRRRRPWRWAALLGAAGVTVTTTGVATAGFAGVLPETVQQQFETVVETVTPIHFPEGTGGSGEPGVDEPGGVGPTGDPGQPPTGPAPVPTAPTSTGPSGQPSPAQSDAPGGRPVTPPGQANKPEEPPGQAKKSKEPPPGQAKKSKEPPGHDSDEDSGDDSDENSGEDSDED